MSLWSPLVHTLFHAAGRRSLRRFEARLPVAVEHNHRVLIETLVRNADTVFGRRHAFGDVLAAGDPVTAFRERVPLQRYTDLLADISRIQRGEPGVLSRDPVTLLAGSAGTTSAPKRIPRTRRAQRHHLSLVVLAEQAVIDRDVPGARAGVPGMRRGINLMSLHAPAPATDAAVPVMAGLNAGVARMRRMIPHLWAAPVAAYAVADVPAGLYLHALFGLREARIRYLQAPFAPQLTAWLGLIQGQGDRLVHDLADGTLDRSLALGPQERAALTPALKADPLRARAVAQALEGGAAGLIPRLWPELAYLRCVTSGSFALALPALRRLAGQGLVDRAPVIHSGCHSSSEGIIGINLAARGDDEYVLAVGTSHFEFIPLESSHHDAPDTVPLEEVKVGQSYEVVLTSCAGLYRYRLGDVIEITGFTGQAPRYRYVCRLGSLLNLAGEKCSELHTREALTAAMAGWKDRPGGLRDYAVYGDTGHGVGRYVFYAELDHATEPQEPVPTAVSRALDRALGDINPYYHSSAREPGRLAPAELRLVRSGTFARLGEWQLERARPATAAQIKIPRVVSEPGQVEILEAGVMAAD